MKYSLSQFANAFTLPDILDICRNLFKVLLCKFPSDCKGATDNLEQKMSDIESYKEFTCENVDASAIPLTTPDPEIVDGDDDLPASEDVYLHRHF